MFKRSINHIFQSISKFHPMSTPIAVPLKKKKQCTVKAGVNTSEPAAMEEMKEEYYRLPEENPNPNDKIILNATILVRDNGF